MDCAIQWRLGMTRDQWNALLNKCPHTTLLQSYYYAQAMREVHRQGARHGIIIIDGKQAGIVQMHEVSLFRNAIHALSIDRGPLWFKGFGKETHLKAFAEALNTQFPPRFGRKRRFLPEFNQKYSVFSFDHWKKIQKTGDYKSFSVDLSPEKDEIRQNFNGKWRNCLNKSEKEGVSVEIDMNCVTLGDFLHHYMQDRVRKRYNGASPRFLAALAKFAAMENNCLILNAREDGEVIASIIVFAHGAGATYQAGWTTPYGRKKNAHHLLLWHAMGALKARGVTQFDLGGYNDEADGIRSFKAGMGGHEIALIGSYD